MDTKEFVAKQMALYDTFREASEKAENTLEELWELVYALEETGNTILAGKLERIRYQTMQHIMSMKDSIDQQIRNNHQDIQDAHAETIGALSNES